MRIVPALASRAVGLLLAVGVVLAVVGPPGATAAESAVARATCARAGGVSVVVDFRELGGTTVTACARDGGGQSASAVLASVGVDVSYATRQPGFVCRVNGVPATDPCVNTSPPDAYWGLWWSDGSRGSWTYSTSGVGGLVVPAGGSVGWAWQQGRESLGPVPPGVAAPVAPSTPSPTPSPSASSSPTRTPSPSPSTSASASPLPSPSPSATATPTPAPTPTSSASPTDEPSDEPPIDDESLRDSRATERSGKGSVEEPDRSGRGDDGGATPTPDDPGLGLGRESPGDSRPSDATEAGDGSGGEAAGEPTRVPAAVTWGVLALLGGGIATSAVVARRRRESDPS